MAEQVLTQCTVGGAVWVHVKDGVITRIRPIIFDDSDAPSWTIEARGQKFTPLRRTTLNPYVVPERTRVYSENRIKYPYKQHIEAINTEKDIDVGDIKMYKKS